MSPRSPVFQAFIGKLPAIHPAILLAPVAIGAYTGASAFAMGDTNTANLPAPIQTAANAVRPLLLGGRALDTDSTSNSTAGVSTIRPAVIPSPTVVIPGAGPSGGGGQFGGGMSGFGSGGVIPGAALPLPHDKLPSGGASNLPPTHAMPHPVPHPIGPPVVRIAPVTPPVVVVPPRPPMAHPPVIVAPPLRMQPFPLGRPMVARPFVGGGGFVRHR
jgi:hypothetical protein